MMSLFPAATRHFVKAVGAKTLHPTLDIASADRFKPLCLVIEKKSFWPWRKPRMTSTLVSLNDVLLESIPHVEKYIKQAEIVKGYKETPQFHIDGDIGSKIAEELNLDMSAVENFEAEVSFGDILKSEVNWEDLEKTLAHTHFNMHHEIWQEIRGKKRASICVVVASLTNTGDGVLKGDSDEKESATAGADVPAKISKVSVNVHAKGESERKKHLSYNILAGTVLAYGCTRLAISEGGEIRMQVQLDKVDSGEPLFTEERDLDNVISEQFSRLKQSPSGKDILECFRKLLQPKVVQALFEVLAVAESTAGDNLKYTRSRAAVRGEIGGNEEVWVRMLSLIGFQVTDDQVYFPLEGSDVLVESCLAISEAVLDFSKEQLRLLGECSSTHASALKAVLKSAIHGETSIAEPQLDNSQGAEVMLLRHFGIYLEDVGGKKSFNAMDASPDESLRNLYAAVDALFG